MNVTNWGIVGPGAIAGNFADGLAGAPSGRLVAVAGRDPGRREDFARRHGIEAPHRHATAEALLADPEVQAVYISTPHPLHATLALQAIRSGKAVLVEKPAAMAASEVEALVTAARQQGVFFMEGFMYRCHPQIARLVEILRSGEIGDVLHVRAAFGFSAGRKAESRLYDRAAGGGGILDVGCYPVSLARLVAGVASGRDWDDPVDVRGTGLIGPTGVDEVAYGLMRFASGVTAEIACAIARTMDNSATITGTRGSLHLPDPWVPGRNAPPADATIEITSGGVTRREELRHPVQLFTFEAEAASRAIARGELRAAFPAMSPVESIGNARAMEAWRHQIGLKTVQDDPATNRALPGLLPPGLPAMPMVTLPGLDRPISGLVLGCDNKDDLAAGAPVWDAFREAGGTTFDTGHIYGGGRHEKALGDWIRARGVADEVTVLVKGAHSPYCLPGAIRPQLDISLERLGLDHARIYILHRDNPEVPVGEFVEVLNGLVRAGRIGIFGGSNWTPARIAQANAYAAERGLQGFSILNNNLSLAVMERPVWAGCLTSNTRETLDFLKSNQIAHLSWSSGARGYFLPETIRGALPEDTGPETCFGSAANALRRTRAEELARRRGTTAHAIATAWVLSQPFPSAALIGPRTTAELADTLSGLGTPLSPAEVDWLNLGRDSL